MVKPKQKVPFFFLQILRGSYNTSKLTQNVRHAKLGPRFDVFRNHTFFLLPIVSTRFIAKFPITLPSRWRFFFFPALLAITSWWRSIIRVRGWSVFWGHWGWSTAPHHAFMKTASHWGLTRSLIKSFSTTAATAFPAFCITPSWTFIRASAPTSTTSLWSLHHCFMEATSVEARWSVGITRAMTISITKSQQTSQNHGAKAERRNPYIIKYTAKDLSRESDS